MKLLAVIENLDNRYGGPANSLPNLLFHLQKNYDMEVEIVSVRLHNDEINEHIERTGIPWNNRSTLVGPAKIMYSPTLKRQLAETITKDTIVYINNLWNYVAFCAYKQARSKGAKVIIAPRGGLFPWALKQRYCLKKFAWRLFQGSNLIKCDRVHVTSEEESQAACKLGVASTAIGLSAHGVYLPAITNPGNSLPAVHGKYFLFLSRLHRSKGILELLEWWRSLAAHHPDWTLVIAGPDYGNFSGQCNGSQIRYVGPVGGTEKWKLLANARFLAHPSHTENFGIVIAEALGVGTPVITTQGTPWGVLNQVDCGQWVPLSQFRQALERYLSKAPGELVEAGLRGQRLIQEQYSWDAQSRQFYQQLIAPLTASESNINSRGKR